MSTGAIVAIAVVGLLVAVFIPLRIDVARQRRAVETARARLTAANVRRRAEGVPVEAVLQIGDRVTHVSRKSTVALADDGLYCLSEDGRWGARVPFGGGAPGIGDVALAEAPAVVKGGVAVGAALAAWLVPALPSLPSEGLLLSFQNGLAWFVAVPDADEWYGALPPAVRTPR